MHAGVLARVILLIGYVPHCLLKVSLFRSRALTFGKLLHLNRADYLRVWMVDTIALTLTSCSIGIWLNQIIFDKCVALTLLLEASLCRCLLLG